MPLVQIDVTTAGLVKEGDYVGTVQSVKHQIRTGEKWNADGTSDVDFETWNSYSTDNKRLQYSISIPGQGNVFNELYMKERALGFVKDFFKKCRAPFNREGFDTEAPIGKQIGVSVSIKDDPEYGEQNSIKFTKVT